MDPTPKRKEKHTSKRNDAFVFAQILPVTGKRPDSPKLHDNTRPIPLVDLHPLTAAATCSSRRSSFAISELDLAPSRASTCRSLVDKSGAWASSSQLHLPSFPETVRKARHDYPTRKSPSIGSKLSSYRESLKRRHYNRFDKSRHYKPFLLRAPRIILLILTVICFIGIMEYSWVQLRPLDKTRGLSQRDLDLQPLPKAVLSEIDFPHLPTPTYLTLVAVTWGASGGEATVSPGIDKNSDCVEAAGLCRVVATNDTSACPAAVMEFANEDGNHPPYPNIVSSGDPCLKKILQDMNNGKCEYFDVNWRRQRIMVHGPMMEQTYYRVGNTHRCERLGAVEVGKESPVGSGAITLSGVSTSTWTTQIGGVISTLTASSSLTSPTIDLGPGASSQPITSTSHTTATSTSMPLAAASSSASSTASSSESPPTTLSTASSSNVETPTPTTSKSSSASSFASWPVIVPSSSSSDVPSLVSSSSTPLLTTIEATLITTQTIVTVPVLTLTKIPNDWGGHDWGNVWVPKPDNSSSSIPANTTTLPTTVVTLHNPTNGHPMATVTQTLVAFNNITLAKYLTTATLTITSVPTNSHGSSLWLNVSYILTTQTQTEYLTRAGIPHKDPRTFDSYPPEQELSPDVRPITATTYFIGAFVPALMSVFLGIVVQVLNANVKRMVPFILLSRGAGATARDSILLSVEGPLGPFTSFRLLRELHEPAGILGDLLSWCSGLLIALSKDVLYVETNEICRATKDPDEWGGVAFLGGCFMYLDMRVASMRVAEGLLVVMGVLLAVLGWVFWRWRVDLGGNPWSLGVMGRLLAGGEDARGRGGGVGAGELKGLLREGVDTPVVKGRYIDEGEMIRGFEGRRFALGSLQSGGVGIVVVEGGDGGHTRATAVESGCAGRPIPRTGNHSQKASTPTRKQKCSHYLSTPHGLHSVISWAALFLLVGLMILILYYENTRLPTSFERWMNSDTFAVHFLFSGMGVLITMFWDAQFSRVARLSPYRYLSQRPRTARDSILVAPSTNVFTGLWKAVGQRDALSAVVAFAGVLSKFTPILLANVPFSTTVTWHSHEVCTWLSVAILSVMVVVLVASFLVKWPYMPVEPGTIAGVMYYICDSEMLGDVASLGAAKESGGKAHRKIESGLVARYRFGKTVGVSGNQRIAVDYAHVKSEP